MHIALYVGDRPPVYVGEAPFGEDGMTETVTLRTWTGRLTDKAWRLDVEVGVWNEIPRIVKIETEDYVTDTDVITAELGEAQSV